jgi:hypothetical protein
MSTMHPRLTVGTRGVSPGRRATPRVRITSLTTAPLVVVAAAAITVAGALMGSAPARAIPPVPLDPPCLDWSYTGTFNIMQDNGFRVQIDNWSGASAPPGNLAATLYLADGTPAQVDADGKPVQHGGNAFLGGYHSNQTGTASGGFQGNTVNLDVAWDSVTPLVTNHYTGTIAPGGLASGTQTNSAGVTGNWHSPNPLLCSHIPAI